MHAELGESCGRHSKKASDLEAAGCARALDSLLMRLVAHDDLIRGRCGAPLWGAQEHQSQAHESGQQQHDAEVVADSGPDPKPVESGKPVRREKMKILPGQVPGIIKLKKVFSIG